MKNITLFVFKFFVLFLVFFGYYGLYSLERDYYYEDLPLVEGQEPDYVDEDGGHHYFYQSNELCKNCFEMCKRYLDEVDVLSIPNLKKRQTSCWPYVKQCYFC